MKTPPKAFITYSHENADKRKRLETALAVMINNGEIEIWCDAEISSGDKWEREIAENLKESDILLYLVSAHSLASKNSNKELSDILSESPNIPVIPIILDDCDFLHHSLADFQALPTKDKNIVSISDKRWKNSSEAWQNVVEGIRKKIAIIPCKPTPDGLDTPPSTSIELKPVPLIREHAVAELLNHANFLLMLGNKDLAIAGYTKAIELKPNYAVAYSNRGVAYNHKGDNDLALADFNKAIALYPNYVEAYVNRGIAYDKKNEYDSAIADYTKAIELNPKDAVAHYNRGIVYSNKGEHDLAIADYTKAIELNPERAVAYSNRGGSYGSKGKHDLALADFNKVIELNPEYAKAYINRGTCYGNKIEHDFAIADFNKAIELNSNYAEAYANLGITKRILQDFKGAKEDLEIALQLVKQQGNKILADRIQKEIDIIPADSD